MILIGFALAFVVFIAILLKIDFILGRKKYQNQLSVFQFDKKNANYKLLSTGDTFFSSLFHDIEQATTSVDVMFFIVRNDAISMQLYRLLKEKVKQGIPVRLLVDWVGSFKLPKSVVNDLKESGIQFAYSEKPSFPYLYYKLNRRNHRKITVIDNSIAYTGGFNVGDEYIGKDPKLGTWRDYHLRITGDIVEQLKIVFDFDWNIATNKKQLKQIINNRQEKDKAIDTSIQLLPVELGQLEDTFVNFISNSRKEVLIGTPYFIPSKRIVNALLQAINRGVDVKVIAPNKADHPFVKPGAIPFYRKIHQAGGKVYLYHNGFYHSKVIIIDEQLCDVGTANMDMRSIFLNKEINCVFHSDTSFITEIRSEYFKDLKKSQPFSEQWIKQQPLKTKLAIIIARVIRPLL